MISWALIFAIASPLIWGFMNILDKYVVSHRVKRPLGFAVYTTWMSLLMGLIISFFVNWEGVGLNNLSYPIFTGVIGGLYFFAYYFVMQKEDASHMVGLVYSYPIIVAILSFFILGEKISLIGYFGMILVLTGILMISIRLKQIKLKIGIWFILLLILITAIWEFSVKIITNNVPVWNGFAVACIVNGIVGTLFLFNKTIRKDFVSELKNFKWAFLTETFTFFSTITTYLAMAGLQATIVSSIAAIQPLAVLIYERIAQRMFGKMSRDTLLLPKLAAIVLIVAGVILLSIAGA